jgi:hypothetical protein
MAATLTLLVRSRDGVGSFVAERSVAETHEAR